MASTDNRVVDMQFKAAAFADGVAKTIDALAKLKDSLRLDGANKGFQDVAASAQKNMADVNAATGKFNAGPIIDGTQRIAASFTTMQVIAMSALNNIVNRAMDAGLNMVKSLSGMGPIQDGLSDYHTKLTSVQTIMNATGATIEVVNGYFKELDTYADKTIYNLTDMTSSFAKFTNAGVAMDKSVPAIKGIANMVALAGQDAGAAQIAMYNLSQAIGEGFLSRANFKSLELANVATKEWKDQMIAGAIAAGTLEKKGGDAYHIVGTKAGAAMTAGNLFIDGLQEGWATATVMTNVLGDYGNELTAIGGKAQAAAQDVKSFPMMMETLKASVGTGWTDTFEILFGNVTEAKVLWTGLTNTIGGFLGKIGDSRNELLKLWKDHGGRDDLINGLKDAFKALGAVLGAIGKAFRDVFPATTAGQLLNMTERFKEFTATLKPSEKTIENIRRTFAGLFAALSIGWQIIKAAAGAFFDLIHNVFGAAGGADGILNFTGNIGDFIVNLDEMFKKSGVLKEFFDTLGAIIQIPLEGMLALAGIVGKLFTGFSSSDADSVGDALENVGSRMEPILGLGDALLKFFEKLGDLAETAGKKIAEGFSDIGNVIADNLTGANFDRALDVVNTGLLGALVLMIKKFMTGGANVNVDLSGGLFDNMKQAFGSVTETLQNMQTNLKADVLLKIATSLGIMAASIFLLSTIDPEKLATGLGGLAAGFLGLSISMMKIAGAISYMGTLKLPFVTAALIGLAGSLILIAIALKIMSTMSLADTIQALYGMAGAIALLLAAMKLMPKDLQLQALALIALGIALNLIATAMKIMSTMDLGDTIQALYGMGGALALILGAMRLMPKGLQLQAVALLALGISLNAIAIALKIMSTMNLGDTIQALYTMAGALALILGAMRIMPNDMLAKSVAMIAIGVALNLIGLAIRGFAGMSWPEIARGMVTLAGAMLILGLGLNMMKNTIPGAIALAIASASLMMLVPVLIALGLMSWENIIKGLVMLAGVFLILGVAGYALSTVVPIILALGASLFLIGAGFALAGAGALMFATAFSMFVVLGAAGATAVGDLMMSIVDRIPGFFAAIAAGIIAFAGAIAQGGVQFYQAFITILDSLLQATIDSIPKIGLLFETLVMTAVDTVVRMAPKLYGAGIDLIVGFLDALAKRINRIITVATDLIVNFITGIKNNLPRIIQAGIDLVVSFMNGIGDSARNNSDKMADAGWNMVSGMVEGFVKGVKNLGGKVKDAAIGMAKDAFNGAMDWLGINSPSRKFIEIGKWSSLGMAEGIDRYAHVAAASSVGAGEDIIEAMGKTIAGLGDLVSSELGGDLAPVVTPVLDLSQVQKDSSQISRMLADTKGSIKVDSSYSAARNASAGYSENQLAAIEVAAGTGTNLEFTQINNSPKAISAAETYRNTKSLISVAKGALSTVAD